MKRIVLIISHLGAGSANLCYSLAQTDLIQWVQDGIIYDDLAAMESILSTKHKYSSSIGLYVNEVLYNYQISYKPIYEFCEIVYLVRNPRNSIKILKLKDAEYALNYYIFRLRRIYEMSKRTRNAIFLTWDDLINKKGLSLLAKRFNLPDLYFEEHKSEKIVLDLPKSLLTQAQFAYELCLYRLRNNIEVVKC